MENKINKNLVNIVKSYLMISQYNVDRNKRLLEYNIDDHFYSCEFWNKSYNNFEITECFTIKFCSNCDNPCKYIKSLNYKYCDCGICY